FLARTHSISFKCLIVRARSATNAGKYMLSPQFTFVRETMISILEMSAKYAKRRERFTEFDFETVQHHLACLAEESQDSGGDEDISKRDLKKEKPAEPHELIVTKTRQRPAHPHEHKNEHRSEERR